MYAFLAKHNTLCRCALCVAAFAANIIHPLIHGTPLDSGMLDGMLAQLNMMAAHSTINER